ncbi:peptidoglycan editing factor PgeF [Herbaspirillum sp. AP02]|uniref:peptidoglycan editing factor PgeF n=1 Tax=unclassified Herbaspirillum TaxID=2624150 RepID=UPI0015DAD748|nr:MULTISPECIES: peptidoglycan editing factor PgeF [unclassified Herbaspirillum]MBG7620648.1 peptidoglycan editing factor PgeF [Herbaspirillum sp. AP02]NZD68112.1 peptidoglycan editing factor PgeF [Herbaspirillum sp. AP21]
MELLIPDWPAPAGVGAMTTLRAGGYSPSPYDDGHGGPGLNLGLHVADDPLLVARNRALLRRLLPQEPAWLSQVHGVQVLDAAALPAQPEADGCISSMRGAVCVMMTADCLPVLFCDRAGTVVGAAHAGWRGLAAGVLERTVAAMRERGAADVMAWLGPAIGPENFEVGAEVREAFLAHQAEAEAAFRDYPGRPGKYLADIYQLARQRLAAVGVHDVGGGGLCTVADQRFYSYRRDKTTGRMASLIWLK